MEDTGKREIIITYFPGAHSNTMIRYRLAWQTVGSARQRTECKQANPDSDRDIIESVAVQLIDQGVDDEISGGKRVRRVV